VFYLSLKGQEGKGLKVYARSILQSDSEQDSGGGDSLFPTMLTLRGLNLSSSSSSSTSNNWFDGDVEPVKCRIVCAHGVVSINPTRASSLDFTSAAYCFDQVTNQKATNNKLDSARAWH